MFVVVLYLTIKPAWCYADRRKEFGCQREMEGKVGILFCDIKCSLLVIRILSSPAIFQNAFLIYLFYCMNVKMFTWNKTHINQEISPVTSVEG